jgi:hypothetical protein
VSLLLYNDETMLTTGEAARVARKSPQTIVVWCNSGKLAHQWDVSGHRRIRYGDLIAATTIKKED